MDLEPIDPETALELYLADKQNELAEASLKGKNYRLQHFVRWCHEKGIENLYIGAPEDFAEWIGYSVEELLDGPAENDEAADQPTGSEETNSPGFFRRLLGS